MIRFGITEQVTVIHKMNLLTKSLVGIFLLVFLIVNVNAYSFQTTYNPFSGKLDFYQNENYSGHNLTANYFVGDGSKLTGIVAEGNVSYNSTYDLWAYNQSDGSYNETYDS